MAAWGTALTMESLKMRRGLWMSPTREGRLEGVKVESTAAMGAMVMWTVWVRISSLPSCMNWKRGKLHCTQGRGRGRERTDSGFDGDVTALGVRGRDACERVVLPGEPGREGGGGVGDGHIGARGLWVPDAGRPCPAEAGVGDAGGRAGELALEGAEEPAAVRLFGIDVPDVVALGL